MLPFPSAANVSNVTRGVWMWRLPLKHLNNKKDSILILDCEGVNNYNKNISADLYLFCMIISTVFGVILGHARIDSLLSDRLYKTDHDLKAKRFSLINKYIEKIKTLAEIKIYGSNSILLNSDLFINKLIEVEERMNQYNDPEILFNEIRSIHSSNDQNDQASRQESLSVEMKKKVGRIVDRIYREERITESIDPNEHSELQMELEQCENEECCRLADCINITHSKRFCSSKRQGNYYRYNNEVDTMVCDACRELANISRTSIKCRDCGKIRRTVSVR